MRYCLVQRLLHVGVFEWGGGRGVNAGRDYDKMGSVDLAYDLLLVAVLSL